MASFHMDGDALVWFQDNDEIGVFATWESFVEVLLRKFGNTAYEDPMESLTRLRQTTNVVVHKGKFKALSNRIRGLSDNHKLSCFLSGLKDKVRLPVKMLNPKNLNEAFGLAKIQEEYLNSSCRSQRSSIDYSMPSIWVQSLRLSWNPDLGFPCKGYHLLKWRKGERRVFVSTVMRSSSLVINVSLLSFSC